MTLEEYQESASVFYPRPFFLWLKLNYNVQNIVNLHSLKLETTGFPWIACSFSAIEIMKPVSFNKGSDFWILWYILNKSTVWTDIIIVFSFWFASCWKLNLFNANSWMKLIYMKQFFGKNDHSSGNKRVKGGWDCHDIWTCFLLQFHQAPFLHLWNQISLWLYVSIGTF